MRKEIYGAVNISHENRCKKSKQSISKYNSTTYKRIIHHTQVRFIPVIQDDSIFKNQLI
jgi:hypothetical protein